MHLRADKAHLGWKAGLHKWDRGQGRSSPQWFFLCNGVQWVQSQPPGKGEQI